MKLDNKASYEMTEEIALTDTELEAVHAGCGWENSTPSYDSGYPSVCGTSSNNTPGYPLYTPNYNNSPLGPNYNTNPFDTSNCNATPIGYSVTTYYSTAPTTNGCGGY